MEGRSYQRLQPAPLALRVAGIAFLVVWVPAYWIHNGPANFLWLCDLANFLAIAGLWCGSRLLVSSQAVGVLVVQAAWTVDFFGRLLFGQHPFGGTEYMFDAAEPLFIRGLSLFHLAMPVLLLFLVDRWGYDRRGLLLETLVAWVVLPFCAFATDPALNLNWLAQPFNREQTWLSPAGFLVFALVAYPLVLFLPSHLALTAWRGRPRDGSVERLR